MKNVNRNFPNYTKTEPSVKVISKHPPGLNRKQRRQMDAWDRGAQTREKKRIAEAHRETAKIIMRKAIQKRIELNKKRSAARKLAAKTS